MKLTTTKQIFDKQVLRPGMAIKYKHHWTSSTYRNAIIKTVTDEVLYLVEVTETNRKIDVTYTEIKIIDSAVDTIRVLKDSSSTIQIEDFYGNEIMSFTINNDLKVLSMNECEIAEKKEDRGGRPVIRLQSTKEPLLIDSESDTNDELTSQECIKQTSCPKSFRDLNKTDKES